MARMEGAPQVQRSARIGTNQATKAETKPWSDHSCNASIAAAACGLIGVATSHAGTVTVITSFPKELTAAYKAAFEKANPDIKIEILNKSTVAGIAFVRETAAGQRPDVFWASAPDAFEVLKRDNLLVSAPEVDNKAIPAKIGNYPINDPQGFYKGQALAGYGIMYNTRYLKANKLTAPKEWDDLLKREWFGHVAMTAPSRSGHDAPDGRDDPAGRRVGRRLGQGARNGGQQRADHRAQLRCP